MLLILRILSVALLLILSAPLYAACDKSLRIVRVGSEGLDDQVAKTILERAGCSIELVNFERAVPLARRMALLETGHIDLVIAVNKRPERELIGNFSIAFEEERIRVWTTDAKFEKYKNLSLPQLVEMGVRVIGPSSGYYGPDFEALKQSNHPQLVLYKQVPDGLRLLERDRGDVFLGSEHFQDYFRAPFIKTTFMLPQVIHRDGFHFMFSKKTVSPETIDLINNTIREFLTENNSTEMAN